MDRISPVVGSIGDGKQVGEEREIDPAVGQHADAGAPAGFQVLHRQAGDPPDGAGDVEVAVGVGDDEPAEVGQRVDGGPVPRVELGRPDHPLGCAPLPPGPDPLQVALDPRRRDVAAE
jgi:hypothetical protein